MENGGVFVVNAKALGSVAPRTASSKFSGDLTKMNPEMNAMPSGMTGATPMVSRGREVGLGLNVIVIKGNHKGYKGIIKDLNGPLARIELHTRMRTITIERNKLGVEDASSKSIKTLEEWERDRNAKRSNATSGSTNSNGTPMGSRTPGGLTSSAAGGYAGYSSGKYVASTCLGPSLRLLLTVPTYLQDSNASRQCNSIRRWLWGCHAFRCLWRRDFL